MKKKKESFTRILKNFFTFVDETPSSTITVDFSRNLNSNCPKVVGNF